MGFFFILPLCLFFSKKKMFSEFLVSLSFIMFSFCFMSFDSSLFLFKMSLLTWLMIVFSCFIVIMMYFSNFFFLFLEKNYNFCLMVFMLYFSLLYIFFSMNLFLFYILFEFSVLPIFFVICSMGFNFERLESAYYMLFYTFIFSLPFIIFIFNISSNDKTLFFLFSSFLYKSWLDYLFVFFSVFVFFVKIPSFFFHIWLPKAHVEAPISGSMVLAGVLLKLGVYGMMIFFPFIYYQLMVFSDCFFFWGIFGSLLSSFICLFQVDLKKIIAYMSIMHMGMIISSIFSFLLFSFYGILIMMVSHGFTSSLLFYLLNCFYERFYSRSIFMIKGGLIIMPSLCMWFMLSIACNISIPPFMSFFSELFLIFSILSFSLNSAFILFSLVFFNSIVSFYFFVSMFHGFSLINFSFLNMDMKEMFVSLLHLISMITFFLFLF